MNMKTIKTVLAAAALLAAASCLSSCYIRFSEEAKKTIKDNLTSKIIPGEILADTLALEESIKGISVSGANNIEVIQDSEQGIVLSSQWYSVKAEGDTIPCIRQVKCEVVDGILRIEPVGSMTGYVDITVRCRMPESISKSGSGSLKLHGFQGHDLEITSSGSGDMDLGSLLLDGKLTIAASGSHHIDCQDINVAELEYRSSGSGTASFSGETMSASLSKAGSGNIDASGLDIKGEASVSNAGSGTITYRQKGQEKVVR